MVASSGLAGPGIGTRTWAGSDPYKSRPPLHHPSKSKSSSPPSAPTSRPLAIAPAPAPSSSAPPIHFPPRSTGRTARTLLLWQVLAARHLLLALTTLIRAQLAATPAAPLHCPADSRPSFSPSCSSFSSLPLLFDLLAGLPLCREILTFCPSCSVETAFGHHHVSEAGEYKSTAIDGPRQAPRLPPQQSLPDPSTDRTLRKSRHGLRPSHATTTTSLTIPSANLTRYAIPARFSSTWVSSMPPSANTKRL